MFIVPAQTAEDLTFDQQLSNKLHSKITVKPLKIRRKNTRNLDRAAQVVSASKLLSSAPCPSLVEPPTALAPEATSDAKRRRLVPSTKRKDEILNQYQEQYGGNYQNPITTQSLSQGTSADQRLQPPSQRSPWPSGHTLMTMSSGPGFNPRRRPFKVRARKSCNLQIVNLPCANFLETSLGPQNAFLQPYFLTSVL